MTCRSSGEVGGFRLLYAKTLLEEDDASDVTSSTEEEAGTVSVSVGTGLCKLDVNTLRGGMKAASGGCPAGPRTNFGASAHGLSEEL